MTNKFQTPKNEDEYFMKMTLALAKKGLGNTNPNPLVGAMVVKNGRILAKGYHKKAGLPHAEIEALKNAGDKAKGATLYVNLEPCNHFGRTPPCTDSIIEKGIRRVVIGMRDPNPMNNGKGIRRLRQGGIDIKSDVLKKESLKLNRVFCTYITKKRPYVTIKAAQSLDGKIATFSGDSKWITNESSRRFVHRLRSHVDAVLVGVNTIIRDDPLLNARIKNSKKQPVRIVLDSEFKTPEKSRIIKDKSSKVIIATTKNHSKKRKNFLEFKKKDVETLFFKKDNNRVDLKSLLRHLAKNGISHILVEGGGAVIASFLENRLADEMLIFISPKIIGGKGAVTSVEGRGVRFVNQAIRLKETELKRFGEDILIRGYVYGDN